MRSFFKSFFATLLALVVFGVFVCLFGLAWLGHALTASRPRLPGKSVLYIDLSYAFREIGTKDIVGELLDKDDADVPGLYDVIRLIRHAKGDSSIKGIFLKCTDNDNGMANSEELRDALLDFRESGKFVYAFGDVISQKAYYVANAADKVFCNPAGSLEWAGLSAQVLFLKHTLDKLEVDPQIFYDGKFKSATEPLRMDHMSDASKSQTADLLQDLNSSILGAASVRRGIDTATLARYEREGSIQTAYDALQDQLVDGDYYRDQVLGTLQKKLDLGAGDDVNFVSIFKYNQAVELDPSWNGDQVAVIAAQGDIVYGKGDDEAIGSDDYIHWIREAVSNSRVKAIVLRVNSPGGSSLASDLILRELEEAKKAGKPVVVSMGDLAASGGYYISSGADSIFAEPTTITGSIGVFSIIPNLGSFFKDKLGVTFDGVKTSPYADMGTATRPLTGAEKKFLQADVDSTYLAFKRHVAEGRHMSLDRVEAIAQGHVYSGTRALRLGLVDRMGGIQDAVDCAAKLAGVKTFSIQEYPVEENNLQRLRDNYGTRVRAEARTELQQGLGPENARIWQELQQVRRSIGTVQLRLPYDLEIR